MHRIPAVFVLTISWGLSSLAFSPLLLFFLHFVGVFALHLIKRPLGLKVLWSEEASDKKYT